MTILTYDLCLLISAGNDDTDRTGNTNRTDVPDRDTTICFNIVGIQTDDTFSLSDDAFF